MNAQKKLVIISLIIAVIITVIVILVYSMSNEVIVGTAEYDEDAVSEHYLDEWELFKSINGFSNDPNVNCSGGEAMYIEIHESAITHNISLEPSRLYEYSDDYDFTVLDVYLNYTRTDGNLVYNSTMRPIGSKHMAADIFYMTAWQDDSSATHIFWKGIMKGKNNETKYIIFYTNIDESGDVIVENFAIYSDPGYTYDATPPSKDIDYFTPFRLMLYAYITNLCLALTLISYEWRKLKTSKKDFLKYELDSRSRIGEQSYHYSLFLFLVNPLTISFSMVLLLGWAGFWIFIFMAIYPFAIAIPLLMGLYARENKNGMKGLLLSSLLLAFALVISLTFIMNIGYMP